MTPPTASNDNPGWPRRHSPRIVSKSETQNAAPGRAALAVTEKGSCPVLKIAVRPLGRKGGGAP